jgi:uncharacterized membrane protein YhdT
MMFIIEGLLFIAVAFIVVMLVLKAIELLQGDDNAG